MSFDFGITFPELTFSDDHLILVTTHHCARKRSEFLYANFLISKLCYFQSVGALLLGYLSSSHTPEIQASYIKYISHIKQCLIYSLGQCFQPQQF